ncbi:MAG: S23 ribosomal protein, nonfunctional [Candidatus Woesebacteria bacterium GW2011_GWA1_33_30]|uniref:S23 ribosomal protein, nonfunctional n=1 Tax=Candidatus Woesebacteria bacterium GW2011_GWA2_33_28 TaxID=1618561 RepID=A0A0G0CY48_9BACT|nr:MAG: S23 ribosomal protein, nonfunctional [Candidatus Woesebacteria bacterium GW2011_GWA2_33_28]KKP49074.1 MAG: S23 ribosomal protein, nonfunctional [Candidatus Woesebacteria bacterium GW2011_GWA1_33_30]KKP50326.1 MAG: S23 ribosomal protein, nonfunctional [Microgenomates group bacterium GW2011_GWC1_33_32]KKP52665.1 MAG: S23 ribosomal protein, nonfunctional [Candidatus Woesebacteria bacterium GW2011_GWB1_33_38]KKP58842.1 MAG: S23 ribosomal protein, nonfunctional [Microgenomates group bacteriu
MNIVKFEDLEIWKSALLVTKDVYDITSQGKFSKDFGLRDQIRRAVVSISSNIVEGFEKRNNNEFRRFLMISKGSAGEVRNQLYIALSINYINKLEFDKINSQLLELSKRMGAFISYLTKK